MRSTNVRGGSVRRTACRVARLAGLAALGLLAGLGPAVAGDPPAAAAAAEPGRLTLATERVAIFKDGYALYVKAATGTADERGQVFTDAVPDAAVLGCVWAVTGTGDERVLSMRSAWHATRTMRTREAAAVTTLDLLRANVGRRVTLGLVRENAPDVEGVLEVLEQAAPPEPEPAGPEAGPAGETVTEVTPRGGQLVVLQSGDTRLVLPLAEVRTGSGKDLATRTLLTERVVRRAKRLTFDFGAASAGKPASLRLLYFAEGLRWIPTYRVSGALEADARLALQGEILNEAEDLAGAAVDLVVGVPSFRFRDVVSPLSLERAMRGALQSAAPQLAQQMLSNSMRSFGNEQSDMAVQEGDTAPATPAELAGRSEQDLFVHAVGRVDLARGARASVPLWQATAPLRHLYTLDVEVVRNQRSGEHVYQSAKAASAAPTRGARPAPASLVWHELELANTGTQPWTTGAALLLKGDLPLGQDVLRYTSPGGKTLLPMTVAVDLRGRYEERELERRPNAIAWSGESYSLVVKQGTVTATSFRKEASPLRVTVSVGGKVEEASDQGRIVVNDLKAEDWTGGAYAVNNHSDIAWDLTLEPGQSKTLTYRFGFYVR
ncbi:MAG: hypothetical protein ACKOSS_08690 [Planctomycetia bacterium]